MDTSFVRLISGGSLCLCAAIACRSTTGVAAVSALDPAPRFTCVSSSAAVDAPAAFRGIHGASVLVPDDSWADLARTLPGGFAGIYVENGKLVVNFVDPAAGRSALAEISQRSQVQPADTTLWNQADVEAVRWNFAQLYEWQNYVYSLHAFAGLTSSDLDEKRNSVTFGFIDEPSRNSFIDAMNAAKLPCNLILTEIRAPAVAA